MTRLLSSSPHSSSFFSLSSVVHIHEYCAVRERLNASRACCCAVRCLTQPTQEPNMRALVASAYVPDSSNLGRVQATLANIPFEMPITQYLQQSMTNHMNTDTDASTTAREKRRGGGVRDEATVPSLAFSL